MSNVLQCDCNINKSWNIYSYKINQQHFESFIKYLAWLYEYIYKKLNTVIYLQVQFRNTIASCGVTGKRGLCEIFEKKSKFLRKSRSFREKKVVEVEVLNPIWKQHLMKSSISARLNAVVAPKSPSALNDLVATSCFLNLWVFSSKILTFFL